MYMGSSVLRRTKLAQKVFEADAERRKRQRNDAKPKPVIIDIPKVTEFAKEIDRSAANIEESQRIKRIILYIAKSYNVKPDDITGQRRFFCVVEARHVAMFLAVEMSNKTTTQIGKVFGDRDHSSIIHAHNKIKRLIKTDDRLRWNVESVRKLIEQCDTHTDFYYGA